MLAASLYASGMMFRNMSPDLLYAKKRIIITYCTRGEQPVKHWITSSRVLSGVKWVSNQNQNRFFSTTNFKIEIEIEIGRAKNQFRFGF